MGDLVDGEVFADVPLRGLPHEGAFRGVQFGEEGAVAFGGPKSGLIWDGLVESACGRVYLRQKARDYMLLYILTNLNMIWERDPQNEGA